MAYLIKQINAPATSGSGDDSVTAWSANYVVEQAHTVVPTGLTVPAVGMNVTVSITPLTKSTNLHFLTGDISVVEQVEIDGTASFAAWLEVVSVTGDDIEFTVVEHGPGVSGGSVFAAGQTEITGQTRLPDPPTGVTEGLVTVQAGAELLAASVSSDSPYYLASNFLLDRVGLFEAGFQPVGSPQIDLRVRLGSKLFDAGQIELNTPEDITNFRATPFAPLALASYMEVWFR